MSALATILSRFFLEPVSTGICHRDEDDIKAASDPTIRLLTVDAVASLGLALGVIPVPNPASGSPPNVLAIDHQQTLDAITEHTGWDLLPPICGGIAGLSYQNGVLPLKHLYQVYTAHRLVELNGGPLDRCLEVGGGVGFLAYTCARNGLVRDFTIIDLPIVNVLQGYLLLKSPVAADVVLFGEPARDDMGRTIRLLPDSSLVELKPGSFDMAVNQDSLPEMANETAEAYLAAIADLVTGSFLSINQESAAPWPSGFRHSIVHRLAAEVAGLRRVGRFHYWMRPGYVEEIFAIVSRFI